MAKRKSKKTDPATTNLLPVPKPEKALQVFHRPAELIPTDPLKRYFLEVSRYPILTPEEEKEIAEEYQKTQDKEAAQKLVLANLRLVAKIALEYRSAYYNTLDLIQEGNLGLMRAVQKYDVTRGVRFTSYAAWWVRAFILKFILDNFRLVKVGTTQAQKKLFFNLMKEKERIEKLGFTASSHMLSERLDVREKDVTEMETRMGAREVELDAPKKNFDGALNMEFLAVDDERQDVTAERSELQEILMKHLDEFVKSLSEKEQRIFSFRLFTELPKTLQEIADQYGITRERVRQIEEKIIKKMRTFFAEKGLTVDVGVGGGEQTSS